MNKTSYLKSEFDKSQKDFSQQQISTNDSKILEILSYFNHSHMEKQNNLETFNLHKQPIESRLDQNNNNVYDDQAKKKCNKTIYLQKHHQNESFQREVSKEYILSQLKAQQRIKQNQQSFKEKKNVNCSNDIFPLNNSTLRFQKSNFSHPHKSPDKIEVFDDGNVKNIPPHMLLDQFGIIGLVMMMKLSQSNKDLSLVFGQGEETNAITESLNFQSEYDSMLFVPRTNLPNHLELNGCKDDIYDLFEIRNKLPDANTILKNAQDDLLFLFFYKCSSDFYQLIATKMLNSRGWFFSKELNLWFKNNPHEKNSYLFFDFTSWEVQIKNLN